MHYFFIVGYSAETRSIFMLSTPKNKATQNECLGSRLHHDKKCLFVCEVLKTAFGDLSNIEVCFAIINNKSRC